MMRRINKQILQESNRRLLNTLAELSSIIISDYTDKKIRKIPDKEAKIAYRRYAEDAKKRLIQKLKETKV